MPDLPDFDELEFEFDHAAQYGTLDFYKNSRKDKDVDISSDGVYYAPYVPTYNLKPHQEKSMCLSIERKVNVRSEEVSQHRDSVQQGESP